MLNTINMNLPLGEVILKSISKPVTKAGHRSNDNDQELNKGPSCLLMTSYRYLKYQCIFKKKIIEK